MLVDSPLHCDSYPSLSRNFLDCNIRVALTENSRLGNSNNQQAPGQNNAKENAPPTSGHPNEPDTTMSTEERNPKNVAASTPFMPQSGKLAGIVSHPPNQDSDQREDADPEKGNRLAGSSRWIPQAGKPTGNSSL